MIELLLFEDCSGENDSLSPVPYSWAQEQGAQMLLDGTRTDSQLGSNLFIAATLYQ
jgi:hypothetical protein